MKTLVVLTVSALVYMSASYAADITPARDGLYCKSSSDLADVRTGKILRNTLRDEGEYCKTILNASKDGLYCKSSSDLADVRTGGILRNTLRDEGEYCKTILNP